MTFDPAAYGSAVESILRLDDRDGMMPLVCGPCSSDEARRILKTTSAKDLFPRARHPEAALSGLYLLFSCFDESHSVSQDLHTVEGSYWHGIAHRQEPDAFNAKYWFRRVGEHSIFPDLLEAAAELANGRRVPFTSSAKWDPFGFVDFCDNTRSLPAESPDALLATQIQREEWRLLFDHCARPKS